MSFVYPYFLFAIAVVGIPIIIHLFNFRKHQKIYFSNVAFLKQVQKEHSSQSKLKNILVLLARILTIIFLALAFSQPFIPSKQSAFTAGEKSVSIYVDNSFSMNAKLDDNTLLNTAKLKAKEIASAFDNNVSFNLITNEMSSKSKRKYTKDELLKSIDEIESYFQYGNIQDVISFANELYNVNDETEKILFLISDFQNSDSQIQSLTIDTNLKIFFISVQAENLQNVSIDTCWIKNSFLEINQPNQLIVMLKRFGIYNSFKGTMTLKINNEIKSLSDFTFDNEKVIWDTITFNISQPGWYKLELEISDFPLVFDNHYYLTGSKANKIKVLCITEEKSNKYLDAFYSNNQYFNYNVQKVNQLDYSSIKQYDLILLNELINISTGLVNEIKEKINHGGNVLLIPNFDLDRNNYNLFFEKMKMNSLIGIYDQPKEVKKMNTDEMILKNVFEKFPQNMKLPEVRKSFHFQKLVQSNEEWLMQFSDGKSFISKYAIQNGNLFFISSPLNVEFNDFPVHSTFVPFMYNIAMSASRQNQPSFLIGNDQLLDISYSEITGDMIFKISNDQQEFIAKQNRVGNHIKLSVNNQVQKSGFYKIQYPNNDSMLIAFNYNRNESNITYPNWEKINSVLLSKNIHLLQDEYVDMTAQIKRLNEGVVLWKVCIIFALLFIGAEIFLLRYLK